MATQPAPPDDLPPGTASWLGERTFADWRAQFDCDGYLVFPAVLDDDALAAIRAALAPYLGADVKGRNDFEGLRTNRVYALLAKSPVFADLVTHPLALAFAEADLGRDCLLSACLAINLQPGETVQPWHYDDSHFAPPLPRPSWGVSAFWAIDPMTGSNGATEILPGSHLASGAGLAGAITADAFRRTQIGAPDDDPGTHPDAVKIIVPAGSLMLAKGTLWHRGGANRSDAPRLLITPQYCPGWTRQLENMVLAVPPEKARTLPERAQQLLGYAIHPPFMGYVDGMHPRRVLE
ncbi:phytanoyl-CoA dioxygenase family protein [Blastomonas sp.]|uniref:phytanoyl-CoA dioxygenase family protein n=1 Tax=Blastomonas sp. TaxID=1909299 RepID=UPI0035930C14